MAIDIKKLNDDYTKEKFKLASLSGTKKQIDDMDQNLFKLLRKLNSKNFDLEHAKEKNDKTSQSKLEQEIENIKNQVTPLKQKLQKVKTNLAEQQKKVDDKFAELSKDPETKKKLDTILYKKYASKQKAETNKKTQLEKIKEIANAHPTVKNYLKGIENANKMIKDCNRIINTYNKLSAKSPLTPEEKQTLARVTGELAKAQTNLPIAKTNLAKRQADLKSYLMKHHPEMAKTFIFNNKTQNNFDEFINGIHSYNDLDRQINGCNKTIANCDKAISGLTVSQDVKIFKNPSQALATLKSNKPSWLHPIKRIKYEINARKARKTSEEQKTESKNAQRKAFTENLKLSKEEYQSDIVQEYLKQYEKRLHETAKQNRRNNGNSR